MKNNTKEAREKSREVQFPYLIEKGYQKTEPKQKQAKILFEVNI